MPRYKAQLQNGNFKAHVSLLYGGNSQEAEADLERKMGKQHLFAVIIEEDAEAWTKVKDHALDDDYMKGRYSYNIIQLGC